MFIRRSWGVSTRPVLAVWVASELTLAALGCEGDFRECASLGLELLDAPLRLSGTGLYDDIASDTLAPEVQRYTPQFALWSDGADKRRFVSLPPGAAIDTSNPDAWQFPVGSKLWKEFTRDGVRVETRYLERLGEADDAWMMVAYVWDEAGSDAFRADDGLDNAHGTAHDVPTAAVCVGCHGGRPGRVLGFSAIQLAHDAPQDELNLARLTEQGRVSRPLAEEPRVPGSDVQVAGLGYLHANCSHCHNQQRPESSGPRCYDPQRDFDFMLRVGDRRVSDTAAYRTGEDVLNPDRPSHGRALRRMSTRGASQMPPLATERVDEQGIAQVRAYLESVQ